MTRMTLVLVSLLMSAVPAQGQRAVASSGLNVRKGQTTSAGVVGHIEEGDTVQLVNAKIRKSYYHVQLADGTKGWAWAARLTPVNAALVAPATPAPVTANTVGATAIDASWHKTQPNSADVHWPAGNHALCEAGGRGGDIATNLWKNRTDEPAQYHAVTWSALSTLGFPHNQKKHREGAQAWSSADLAELAKFEGTPIAVEGFLSGVKEELPANDAATHQLKKGESTNCGENTSARVDWHMYLNDQPHGTHKLAVVIETTPRVRPAHRWTLEQIQQLSQQGTPVRISGWLMFDPEHWDQMWKYKGASDTTGTKARITLWEIHPITKIEMKKAGAWVSLDDQ